MKQRDMVALNDNKEPTVQDGDMVIYVPCLGHGCYKATKIENNIMVKQIFEKQYLICPHCGQKFTARCYKNGRVSIQIR